MHTHHLTLSNPQMKLILVSTKNWVFTLLKACPRDEFNRFITNVLKRSITLQIALLTLDKRDK